jgi:hypothetical protein
VWHLSFFSVIPAGPEAIAAAKRKAEEMKSKAKAGAGGAKGAKKAKGGAPRR